MMMMDDPDDVRRPRRMIAMGQPKMEAEVPTSAPSPGRRRHRRRRRWREDGGRRRGGGIVIFACRTDPDRRTLLLLRHGCEHDVAFVLFCVWKISQNIVHYHVLRQYSYGFYRNMHFFQLLGPTDFFQKRCRNRQVASASTPGLRSTVGDIYSM
jgi:hypothetical protein